MLDCPKISFGGALKALTDFIDWLCDVWPCLGKNTIDYLQEHISVWHQLVRHRLAKGEI